MSGWSGFPMMATLRYLSLFMIKSYVINFSSPHIPEGPAVVRTGWGLTPLSFLLDRLKDTVRKWTHRINRTMMKD